MNSVKKKVLGLLFAFCGAGLGIQLSAQMPPTRTIAPKAPQLGVSQQYQYAAGLRPSAQSANAALSKAFAASDQDAFALQRIDADHLGFSHLKFQQFHLGYPVFGAIQKVHIKDGEIHSITGHFTHDLPAPHVAVTASAALAAALEQTGAGQLIADVPGQEAYLQGLTGNPSQSWRPKGELWYVYNTAANLPGEYRLAWRFDIYSVAPLFRADVYIDAETGILIWTNQKLHTADANGIGNTRYSGPRSIVTDSVGTYFRLRETSRALGVETYDMLNGTSYNNAVDIIQLDNIWDTMPSPTKFAGLDAHWGAEMTYDYFSSKFGLNSYDDLGSKLISFVHYDNGYSNAYWNGQFMTYGDGGGNNNPFPGLDVCGHEFTHGVTEYAAGLVYAYEPGALNESFSDIFGNAIEFWARPNNASWRIGDDIGAFRSMADPQVYFNPDTYLGNFWNSGGGDNGGVHTNSGVQNHWFYLLVEGGSGVNDNGDAYNVQGLGLDTAAQIAYRNLSVYLSPGDGYAAARQYAIQSAVDLFGACSPAMIATMNAWYAVGVGNPYTGTLVADFMTNDTNLCHVPGSVQFSNNSFSALSYRWDFGDGNTSTDVNPLHVYNAAGTYTVRLVAEGCNGSEDTLVLTNRIVVDPQQPCNINMPQSGDSLLLTACEGFLYDSGGANDYLPNSNSRITITPGGNQQVQLTFQSFNYAAGDRLSIFDGPNTGSPLLALLAGTSLPPVFTSTSGSLTLYESTNGANNRAGFSATWTCVTGLGTANGLATDCVVYPNPTADQLQVRWARGLSESYAMTMTDALGRVVLTQSATHTGALAAELNLRNLAPGLYTLRVQAGDDVALKKIIVQ